MARKRTRKPTLPSGVRPSGRGTARGQLDYDVRVGLPSRSPGAASVAATRKRKKRK